MPGSSADAIDTVNQYERAIDNYRSIAKWVVASFGAVAASFVVGLSLSTIGSLGEVRFILSVLCVLLAFTAVVAVVHAATKVLEPVGESYEADVSDEGEESDEIAPEQYVIARYTAAVEREEAALKAVELHPEDEAAARTLSLCERAANQLYQQIKDLAQFNLMLKVKETYETAKLRVFIGVLVAGVATIGFAIASNPPDDEPATPVVATPEEAQGRQVQVKPQVHVSLGGPRVLDWPRSCGRLYFALGKLAAEEPRVGPLWPKGSLSRWDRKCGLRSRQDVQRALEFLGRR